MIRENSTSWEDPLPKLVALYFDNQLNERELKQLQTRLKSDPEARIFFVQFSALQTQLEWIHTDSSSPQEMTHLPGSIYSRKKNWNLILYVTCCVCLVLGGLFSMHLMTPVAHVFPEPGSVWSSGNITTEEKLLPGSRRHLLRGAIEIRFTSGSIVNLKAPAQFTVHNSNEIFLQAGKLVADVPESGHGFTVETQTGKIIDLGTSFSVNVGAELNTEIKVYRGKVQVAGSKETVPPREIRANEAVQIDPVSNLIQPGDYTSSDFIPLISRDYAVDQFSDNVIFQEQLPDQIAQGEFQVLERDGAIFLFPEKRDILLSENLPVSITQPGDYRAQEQIETETDFVSRGMKVDCYRIYYDPASNHRDMIRAEGVVHFHQPILGLITTKTRLLETDSVLNPLCAGGNCPPVKHQEVEARVAEDGTHQDILSLSEDRKTLKFILHTGTKYVDEFRVLVASP